MDIGVKTAVRTSREGVDVRVMVEEATSTTVLPSSLTFLNVAMTTWLGLLVHGMVQAREICVLHLKNKGKKNSININLM